MSDEIPFHIQEEIMRRLPVKSVIQFRSVSKAWKSLIDSSEFIAAHTLRRHSQPKHLLVGYENPEEEANYVSFVDDETLFQQRPAPNTPLYVHEDLIKNILGISHGLVCFYYPGSQLASLWNPSIRKSIDIAVPSTVYVYVGEHYVGFGVCPVTMDPKIVTIRKSNLETSYQCEAMVYTLSSGNWTSLSTNLPTIPRGGWYQVIVADGYVYWLGGLAGDNMIISFDLTNENFEMIQLPDSLARHEPWAWGISKIRESLAILQFHGIYTVWMMKDGFQRSFTKLFTIHTYPQSIVGFRKSGVPILQLENDENHLLVELVVYEPNSEHNIVLPVSGNPLPKTVISYRETLLLLGRSDCNSY